MQVDAALYQESQTVFGYPLCDGYQHPPGFASKRMQRDLELMKMCQDALASTWQTVVRDAIRARSALQDEVTKRTQVHVSGVLFILVELFPSFFERRST